MPNSRQKSEAYWAERMGLIADETYEMTLEKEKELAKIYRQSTKEIQARIDAFYQRWADDNGLVSVEEAKKDLTSAEFTTWQKSIHAYHTDIQSIEDEQARKKAQRLLDGLALRSRISREQQLQYEIELELMRMKVREQKSVFGHLLDILQHSFMRTLYEISRGIGYLASFATLPKRAINFILGYKWQGANWSKRIWGNHDTLANQVKDVLAKGFTRGTGIKQMSKTLSERMGVGNYVARRLIQTESNFVANESTSAAMKGTGFINEYTFIAAQDAKTSKVCRHNHNKRYAWSEKKVGVNFPPLHPFCRSTIIPVIDHTKVSSRLTEKQKSKIFPVPDGMSYEQWYNKFIVGRTMELRDPARYSEKYIDKLQAAFDYFKEHGYIFKEHALNRTTGQKSGKDKRSFTRKDVLDVLINGKRYFQEEGDKTVFFKDEIAVVRANDTHEIISIVTRRQPKPEWRELDG